MITTTNGGRPSRHSRGELSGRSSFDRSPAARSELARQQARRKLRRVKTMIVASRAFSDAGRRRRKRVESTDLEVAPHIDEDAECRIVSVAQARMHAHRGPRVANGNFLSQGLPKFFSVPDDIRRHTIVTHYLVLGCREDAMDRRRLEGIGITHVLNTCKQLPNYHPDAFIYHKIPLMDAPDAPIMACFEVAANFLQRVERVGGRCLVHCIAGSSRSVALAIVHLMVSHHVPLHVAFHHINRMRPQANPNEGFKLQLALLEVSVLGGSSVAGRDAGDAWFFYEWNTRKNAVPRLTERYGKAGSGDSATCTVQ